MALLNYFSDFRLTFCTKNHIIDTKEFLLWTGEKREKQFIDKTTKTYHVSCHRAALGLKCAMNSKNQKPCSSKL